MGQATSTNPVLWRVDEHGVAYVTLNRPQVYNAYNGDMIAALLAAFDKLSREPLRVAVITGNGRNFQAGADIARRCPTRPYRLRDNKNRACDISHAWHIPSGRMAVQCPKRPYVVQQSMSFRQ